MTFALSAAQLDEVARTTAGHEPWKLGGAFVDQSRRVTVPALVEAWTLAGMALIGSFDPAKHRDPYGPPASTAITRANAPDLVPVVPELTVAALRARLADLIWLRARDPAMARVAVNAYLEAARTIEDPTNWVFCARYAERSARLATQLRDLDHDVFGYLEEVAVKYRHGEARFLTMEAVRVLAELRPDRRREYIPCLRDVAIAMMEARLFFVAQQALQQIIELARRLNDPELENEAQRDMARSFEAEAAGRAAAGQHGVAAHFYHSAIAAYQRAGRSSNAIDHIRPLLEVEELASLSEMKRIEAPFDPTRMIAYAIKAVSGQPLPDVLFAFGDLLEPCDYDALRAEVVDIMKQTPLGSMLSGTILGPRGRTVARQTGTSSFGDDADEQAIVGRMHANLLFSRRQIDTRAYLIPALHQVNLEHDITISFVTQVVASSAFVPPDRQLLVARGLLAGFEYDFMTAMHFLIPQIENAIRQLLRARKIPTTYFKDGSEREFDLNGLLYERRLEEVMPKGVIFELQCFLIEHRASNFRHQLAHGMLSDDAFSSTDAICIWWLALHLTLAFHPPAVAKPTSDGDGEASNGHGGGQE